MSDNNLILKLMQFNAFSFYTRPDSESFYTNKVIKQTMKVGT